jgi:hypothetical protein
MAVAVGFAHRIVGCTLFELRNWEQLREGMAAAQAAPTPLLA